MYDYQIQMWWLNLLYTDKKRAPSQERQTTVNNDKDLKQGIWILNAMWWLNLFYTDKKSAPSQERQTTLSIEKHVKQGIWILNATVVA